MGPIRSPTSHGTRGAQPPDDAESARVRDGEERAEARWLRVSEASRGRADKTAESGGTTGTRTESRSDEGVPGSAKVDPEDPGGGTDRREVIKVEPGGETEARRSECVAHKDADANTGGVEGRLEVVEVTGNDGIHGGDGGATNGASGESRRVMPKALAAEEAHQHPERRQDSPENPPTPPEPPDGTTKLQNEPPSAELEGEWKVPVSCNAGPTAGETDVPGLPGGDEDPRNRPKGAQNASERQQEHSEHKEEETSPKGARAELGDPGSKAHASGVSGCIKDVRKRPKKL